MDQIFDRFEKLFKSWVNDTAEDLGFTRPGQARRPSGDSDFDAAMDELDDFLNADRTATEARERDRERREREEAARRAGSAAGAGRASSTGPHPKLVAAYRTLGLAYGTPFPEVKSAYKHLLMQNHPDRNSATPEQLKRSTEISAMINSAYSRIEVWTNTGRVSED